MILMAFFWIFKTLFAFDFDIDERGPIQYSRLSLSGIGYSTTLLGTGNLESFLLYLGRTAISITYLLEILHDC